MKKILISVLSITIITTGIIMFADFNNSNEIIENNSNESKDIVKSDDLEIIDETNIDNGEEVYEIVDGQKIKVDTKKTDSKSELVGNKNNKDIVSNSKNNKLDNSLNNDVVEDTSEHHNDQPVLEEGVHFTSGNEFHENQYGVNIWDHFNGNMTQSEAEQLGTEVNVYGYVSEEVTTTTTTTSEFIPAESN